MHHRPGGAPQEEGCEQRARSEAEGGRRGQEGAHGASRGGWEQG
ncbi:hypothetical protein [Geothrix fermentans]|nr:hypothetical protein [Geothrix fermentans]